MVKKYKVVAVDDQIDILNVYKIFFEELEYELIVFTSVIEATNFITENHKEIVYVLSDYAMPDKNGFQFKKELNELNMDLPFIIVTAYYDKEMATIGMSLGIAYFIEKPVINLNFPSAIKEIIDRRINVIEEELAMITSFIDESSPMLDEIEELILKIEADPDNESALNTYYRLLHTIKGTAACVGLKSIPTFVHSYENLISKLKNKELVISQNIINILLEGLDILKSLYADSKNGIIDQNVTDASQIFDFIDIKNNKLEAKSFKEDLEGQSKNQIDKKSEKDPQQNKLTVNVNILDSFMELSGELTVLRNTILKSATLLNEKIHGDKDLNILTEALEEMHKVSSLIQNDISEMRKVNVDSIFKPLKRVVRDASKDLGKEIEFQTSGDELKIDTSIGKILSNALVHMIRNSIDHGIESKEVRSKRNKNTKGKIDLHLKENGEFIVVNLIDDGNGLDLNRIKEKAIEKKLYTEEQLKGLNDQKIYSIIFEAGFSTAQNVTNISGRGVGMDMVRSAVEGAGGKIIIHSTMEVGTNFTIILPIPRSVLIIKSLMVDIDNQMYSIPLDEVKEVISIDPEKNIDFLHTIREQYFIKHHNELIPLVLISNYFRPENLSANHNIKKIVIVKSEGHRYGLVINEIYDIEEIVVKKMSKLLSKNIFFQGVTFVGNGDLALILNLKGIAEHCEIDYDESDLDSKFSSENKVVTINGNIKEYMQFNLINKKNFSIPLNHVHRLENINIKDIEYSGDIPLVQYRGSALPLVFLEHILGYIDNNATIENSFTDYINVIVVNINKHLYGFIVNEICDIGMSEDQINEDLSDHHDLKGTIFINNTTITVLNLEEIIKDFLPNNDKTYEQAA